MAQTIEEILEAAKSTAELERETAVLELEIAAKEIQIAAIKPPVEDKTSLTVEQKIKLQRIMTLEATKRHLEMLDKILAQSQDKV